MATQARIEMVKASRCRGATTVTTLDFDPKKPFVLIFGENGTGKSTLIDAIDMVCNQSAGTLQDRSSVRVNQHLPAIGFSAKDVGAEVRYAGQSWKAALKGAKISVAPSDNLPSATILRRHKVLKLVEATPAERFNELKRFIDVEGVQKSEDAIPKAIKDTNQVLESRTRELTNAEENLKKAFEEDHTPEEERLDAKEWAKKRIETDLAGMTALATSLKSAVDTYNGATTLQDQKNKDQEGLNEKRKNRDAVKAQIDDTGPLDSQTGIVLVDLLNQASKYLGSVETTEACPVCQQPVDGEQLGRDITTRLQQMATLKDLAEAWAKAQQDVATAEKQTANIYVSLIDTVVELDKQLKAIDIEAVTKWTQGQPEYTELRTWAKKLSKEIIAEADQYMKSIPSLIESIQKQSDTLTNQLAQLNAIKRDYQSCIDAKKEATKALAVRKLLEQMHKVVRATRIAYTQDFLDDVADECDRLYSCIHPDEQLGNVRFSLDQEKKGSLLQSGRFEGHDDVSPQAYFSDSHLDTLAFCFFLAVAKKATGGNTTVIVDDVFTSVDLAHIKRILGVLMDELGSYNQIILATHQRRWLDLFLTNQAPANKACVIQLRPWSVATGVCGDSVATYLSELEACLAAKPMKRRDIGSLSGFLIESLLGEMTKYLNCSVKRNSRDKYTGYDLLCGMTKASKKMKVLKSSDGDAELAVVSEGPPALPTIITDITTTLNDVRNTVGDHFNWDAAEIDDKVVTTFGANTLALARMLVCDHCGGMAVRDKVTHLECRCAKLRIEKG
jgi:energy-coupling factor transporter ATP-binding protein EcfA2